MMCFIGLMYFDWWFDDDGFENLCVDDFCCSIQNNAEILIRHAVEILIIYALNLPCFKRLPICEN